VTIEVTNIVLAFLVFARLGAFFIGIPLFGGEFIPVRMRVALGIFISLLIHQYIPHDLSLAKHYIGVILIMINEIFIGLYMAMAVRITFFVLELAGELISTSIGLVTSQSLNPITGSNSSSIGTLLFYLGLLVFFITGIHHEVLRGFVKSFEIVPVGQSMLEIKSIDQFVRDTSSIFLVGLLIAAPFIALNFMINITFAILGKAAPKVNVFITSFAVRIIAGFTLLASSAALIVSYIVKKSGQSALNMLELLTY
jgi:flagellar biosynthetic protein FliR